MTFRTESAKRQNWEYEVLFQSRRRRSHLHNKFFPKKKNVYYLSRRNQSILK